MLNIIKKQLKFDKLFHSYLLIGDDSITQKFIKELIEDLAINSSDIINLIEEKNIKIESIREIIRQVAYTTHSSKYKLVVIYHAEKLNQQSANALLKTLEEPPAHTIFILTTEREEALLLTIISRCQKIRLAKTNEEISVEKENDLKDEISSTLCGSIKDRFSQANCLSQRKDLAELLEGWIMYFRKNVTNKRSWFAAKNIQTARKMLQTNVSPRLILENLFLSIGEK